MKTVVFQSFRTVDVPQYISDCLSSAAAWADGQGYEYRFFDDQFLDLVPNWYRAKAGSHMCVVTDLARLLQARALLAEGFNQVIWIDADVLIFRPKEFTLPESAGFRYCKEVWLQRSLSRGIEPVYKRNNSVCTFGQGAVDHLNKYIAQCLDIVRELPAIKSNLVVSTDVITEYHTGSSDTTCVAMVGPVLLQAIIRREEELIAKYVAWQGSPLFAANLCNSYRVAFLGVPGLFDFLLENAVSMLLGDRGRALAEKPRPNLPATPPVPGKAIANHPEYHSLRPPSPTSANGISNSAIDHFAFSIPDSTNVHNY